MTKKEQAEVSALRARLAALEALGRRTLAPDRDLPIPEWGVTRGWDFNLHTREVERVTSESHAHYWGAHRDWNTQSWRQGGRALYSSKGLALLALRAALEAAHAAELSRIDALLAKGD